MGELYKNWNRQFHSKRGLNGNSYGVASLQSGSYYEGIGPHGRALMELIIQARFGDLIQAEFFKGNGGCNLTCIFFIIGFCLCD